MSNQPSSGGLLGWLTGGSSRSSPPLHFPLPGVSLPPALPDYIQPEPTKITTLPNGLKIASQSSAVMEMFLLCIATMCVIFPVKWNDSVTKLSVGLCWLLTRILLLQSDCMWTLVQSMRHQYHLVPRTFWSVWPSRLQEIVATCAS